VKKKTIKKGNKGPYEREKESGMAAPKWVLRKNRDQKICLKKYIGGNSIRRVHIKVTGHKWGRRGGKVWDETGLKQA